MRDAKRALAEGQSPYEDLYRTGKVCTRAKKTLQKAKDCISKELVWKVYRVGPFRSCSDVETLKRRAALRQCFCTQFTGPCTHRPSRPGSLFGQKILEQLKIK